MIAWAYRHFPDAAFDDWQSSTVHRQHTHMAWPLTGSLPGGGAAAGARYEVHPGLLGWVEPDALCYAGPTQHVLGCHFPQVEGHWSKGGEVGGK